MKFLFTVIIMLILSVIYLPAQHLLTIADVDFEASTGTIKDFKGTAKDIIIPESFVVDGNTVEVSTIGKDAFRDKQLISVTIPNSVTTIGNHAFSFNKLTTVIIPNRVKTIGQSAFSVNKLLSVTIRNGVKNIGDFAFGDNLLTTVTIPNSVTTIGIFAFCTNELTSLTIGESVTTIGEEAFSNNKITSLDIPKNVTTIEGYAFYNNQLTSVTIPGSVTTIGNNVFAHNPLLKEVILPKHKNGYQLVWVNSKEIVVDKINDFESSYTSFNNFFAVEFTISYNNMEEAVNNPNNPYTYTIRSGTIKLNKATKEGYTFAGWYTNPEFTGEAVTIIPLGTTGDIELWAKFNRTTAFKTVKDNSVKINPNPATQGYFILESKSGRGNVKVYSLNGSVVLSQIITRTTQTIKIPELPNGIYLVKVETENGTATKRLINK